MLELPQDDDPDPDTGDAAGAGDGSAAGTGQAPSQQSGEDGSRIKQLSDEAAKYRHRAKAAEESVEQAR